MRLPGLPSRRLVCLALALLALGASGCITRTVRETVLDDGPNKVILRSEKRGSTPVDRGFDHPLTIASTRMAHILSRIDVEDDSGKKKERRPAIPTQVLYPLADALAKGLAAADSSQEVVVQTVERTKRFGVFDRYYLTSLLVFAQDDLLHIQIARSDWEIPIRRRDKLPEPRAGEQEQSFRLLVDDGMSLSGPQVAVVDWRSPIFARPSRTRITPSGKVLRTTILMESPEEVPTPRVDSVSDLSPEQLRALADLEEARRDGKLSESQYSTERSRILAPTDPAEPAGPIDPVAPSEPDAEPEPHP
jgi:hypothetical protein